MAINTIEYTAVGHQQNGLALSSTRNTFKGINYPLIEIAKTFSVLEWRIRVATPQVCKLFRAVSLHFIASHARQVAVMPFTQIGVKRNIQRTMTITKVLQTTLCTDLKEALKRR